jgi:signal transduction histidine kinase
VTDRPHGVVSRARSRKRWLLSILELGVVLPTLAWIVVGVTGRWESIRGEWPQIVVWVLLIALVELMPVPMWRGTHIGMGFPLLMVVAFTYDPVAAAAAALLAASDPRELRHEVGLLRALFNRCQVALAVGAASAIFHAVADVDTSGAVALLAGASLAAIADYLVNATLVCLAASIHYWMNPLRVIRELRVGRLTEFVVSYLGLAVFGVILAKVFSIEGVGFYAVPAFVIPLLLARQIFFRSKALEEAHAELQDREQVLRALSNRMAEERQDERQQIAAFLHDDLAQLLFRLSIQVDVARRHLEARKLDDTEKVLGEIKETKNRTSDRIRALIRDLHRSPLGPTGLADALHSFIVDVGTGSEVRFHTDIDEIELPAPIALLLYHIAREGVMNALKHARAENIWVTVKPDGDEVEMVLRDDGAGFDIEAPEPEGHYGLTMMRERATVGGGSYEVESSPGAGTTVTVRFPTSWLQELASSDREIRDDPSLAPAPSANPPGATPPRDGAAPDTLAPPVKAPGPVRA